MKPMLTPANRERSFVSGFTAASRIFQRRARMKKPKVATKTAAASRSMSPWRMLLQTSRKSTSRMTHHRRKTVTASPRTVLPRCFLTSAASPAG
jgi:hypothetical protein